MPGTIVSFLITFTCGLVLLIVSLVLYTIIKCRIALWLFKYRSKNLPIYEDIHLIGNSLFTLTTAPNVIQLVDAAHRRLGKTFAWLSTTRYGVHTTDLDLIKQIVVDMGEINRSRTDFPFAEIEYGIIMAEDDQWRKLRRNFAPAFKSSRIKMQNVVEDMDNSIQKFVDHIEDRLNSQKSTRESYLFEADEMMHRLVLQIIFSCFYKQTNLIDFADERCYWTEVMDDMVATVGSDLIPKIALLLPVLNPILDWLIRNFHPQGIWRRTVLNFIKSQTKLALEARKHLAASLKQDGGRKVGVDIDKRNFKLADGTQFRRLAIDFAIDKYLDGKLTEDEYIKTSFSIMFAAEKTTTDSLAHMMYLIATHPNEQEECREAIKREGYKADYLGWLINEALRLLPPAPIGCSRTIKKDINIDGGYVIPAGSFVITSSFTIHRLRKYWGDDADEFKPLRWRDTKHHHPLQYVPFGFGQRGCLGKEFALFAIRRIFCALLTRYKLEAKERDDAYIFQTLHQALTIPNSKTYVTIRRL